MTKCKKDLIIMEDVFGPLPILNNPTCMRRSQSINRSSNSDVSVIADANRLFMDDIGSVCSDITGCDQSTYSDYDVNINNNTFHYVINCVRTFLLKRGFIECYFENKLGILTKCNDPLTVCWYFQNNGKRILTQTNRLSLELELINNSASTGFFTLSNCYLNSENQGFHFIPKIEFILKGGMYDLDKMERDLLFGLGFKKISGGNYSTIIDKYKMDAITEENYKIINDNEGRVFFLKNFPATVSKQWLVNVNNTTNTTNEILVIINGKPIIDSFENSCDKQTMKSSFYKLLNGEYAAQFNSTFGNSIIAELDGFLNNDFIIRSSGEINIYNLCECLQTHKLIPKKFLHA
jgi:hypothetical protein